MNLIVPERPDIAGYVPPNDPSPTPCRRPNHGCSFVRCGTLGILWPRDAYMCSWWHIHRVFMYDDARITDAVHQINAAPTGARAVLLTGLHADTTHWTGNPPPVGSRAWYIGWEQAVYGLARELSERDAPSDTLIIGQSEHHPLSSWLVPMQRAASPFKFINYQASVGNVHTPHVHVPQATASMPCLYWTDHRTLGIEHVATTLLADIGATARPVVPWVTEPVPGDEANWHAALKLCAVAGVETAVLFANHHGDIAANKAAIEREWTKVGNWTGGDITAPPRDQPGAP